MALTWQNVAAPNFAGSAYSYRTAADLLKNATQGVNSALSEIQQNNMNRTNAEALSRSMQFTNAEDLNTALRSGSIFEGLNPSELSPDVITSIGKRVNDLQGQTLNNQTIERNQFNFDRTERESDIADQTNPIVLEALRLASNNDQAGFDSYIKNNSDSLGRMNQDQQQKLFTSGLNLSGTNLSNTGRELNNQQRKQSIQQSAAAIREQEEARARSVQSAEIANRLNSFGSPEEAQAYIDTLNVDPRVKQQALSQASQRFPTLNQTVDQRASQLLQQYSAPIPEVQRTLESIDVREQGLVSGFPDLRNAINSDASMTDVISGIRSTGLVDEDTDVIADSLRKIQREARVNPAVAGKILEESLRGEYGFGSDLAIDDARVNASIKLFKDNGGADLQTNLNIMDENRKSVQAAEEAFKKAVAKRDALLERAQTKEVNQYTLKKYADDARKAQEALQQVLMNERQKFRQDTGR